jgi:DNA-binding transcriptional regulator YhcF (GntR family)
MKKIVNGIEIDLTVEEIAQKEKDAIEAQAEKSARESKEAEAIANKQSALTKLSALGLTEAEIKAIIGN